MLEKCFLSATAVDMSSMQIREYWSIRRALKSPKICTLSLPFLLTGTIGVAYSDHSTLVSIPCSSKCCSSASTLRWISYGTGLGFALFSSMIWALIFFRDPIPSCSMADQNMWACLYVWELFKIWWKILKTGRSLIYLTCNSVLILQSHLKIHCLAPQKSFHLDLSKKIVTSLAS